MDALRLFWFFEPRMALWGLGLGTSLGAMYGLFVGVFVPPLGLLFGPLLGGGYGAVAGLALGIMEGAVLWAFTLLFHRGSKPGDTSRYLPTLIAACAVWWTVTKVAEQYIREFGERVNHSLVQASREGSTETRRNQ